VTSPAKRNQVFFRIIAQVTAEFLVVDLQLMPCPTGLAPLSTSFKDLPAQLPVGIGVQSQGRWLGPNRVREASGRSPAGRLVAAGVAGI
jgi:hypothetical protein